MPHAASRERLVDLLWSEADPERARHSLRQAVSTLRRVLGPGSIAADGDTVRLTAAVDSDVMQLDTLLAAGDWDGAVRVSRGRFLEHWALPGASGFEVWAAGERARLEAALTGARETLVHRAVAGGQYAAARAHAHAIVAADPDRQATRRLLLEVLLASGDRAAAWMEATSLDTWLRDGRREPDPATRRLLRRARDERGTPRGGEPPSDAAVGEPASWLAPDLVGRASDFSALLEAWRSVARHGLTRVHVTGAAGLGKTRLVTDVATRLATEGAAVALVRCPPGAHRIAGAALADVATALARLPGALAVPPACAGDLVALAPALTSVYRAGLTAAVAATASGDRAASTPTGMVRSAATDELERRRVHAIEHLLAAVSDERGAVLVIDDVHWADESSARMLLAAFARARAARVLVVTTARAALAPAWAVDGEQEHPRTGGPSNGPAVERSNVDRTLALAPLTASDVEALIRSLGELPTAAAWGPDVVADITRASAGVPFAVLDLLSHLHQAGLLVLRERTWTTDDVAALRTALARTGGPGSRVAALDPAARWCLEILAVAGVPIAPECVDAVRRSDEPARDPATEPLETARGTLALLAALKERDLAGSTSANEDRSSVHWQCAHDEIRDATLAHMTDEARAGLSRRLGTWWLAEAERGDDSSATDRLLRHAAGAFIDGGAEPQLAAVYAAWRRARFRHRASRRSRASDASLARDLLGDAATPERVRTLLSSRPWQTRIGERVLTRMPVGVAAALVLAAGLGASQVGRAAGVRAGGVAHHLSLVTAPIGWTTGLPMSPVPIVEVLDATGRRVTTAQDSIRLRVPQAGAVVGGATAVAVRAGRALFDGATLVRPGDAPLQAVFTYPGVPPLTVSVPRVDDGSARSALLLDRGTINGQLVTPTAREAAVRSGEPITVELDLRYTSPWPAANVVLGATPTWGDPATAYVRLASLVTPAAGYAVHARCRLVAPTRPGTYRLVVAMGAEENVAYLLSGTNWSVGRPVWNDGHDVARWTAAQMAEADAVGSAEAVQLTRRDGPPATGVATPRARSNLERRTQRVAATTLTVRVLPADGAAGDRDGDRPHR